MLTRVQSLLLAPHVVLADAGIPVDSILDESVLSRLGVRAALAYVRIAVDPDHVSGADLSEVHRRPSRGLPQWATKWLDRCRSVSDVRGAAARIDDPKVGQKLDDLAVDLDRLASLAKGGATARDLLTAVRDDIGLGSAMTLLDSSGGASGSHLDDLEALLQVADLHPDAGSFEAWLRRTFHRERAEGGVTLSTIHRVKGREWDRVVVFGATEGLMPHRLSTDVEEERRILHVAITRGRQRVLVLGDRTRRSPFFAELDGSAARGQVRAAVAAASAAGGRRHPQGAAGAHHAPRRRWAQPVKVLGGYEGIVEAIDDTGVRLRLDDGGSFFVRFGERVTVDGTPLTLAAPTVTGGSGRQRAAAGLAAAALQGRQRARLRGPERQAPRRHRRASPHLAGRAAGLPGHRPGQARVLRRRDPRGARRRVGLAERHRPVGHAQARRVDQQDRRHDADGDPSPPARVRAARGRGRHVPARAAAHRSRRGRAAGSARHRRRAPGRDRPPAPARSAPRRSAPHHVVTLPQAVPRFCQATQPIGPPAGGRGVMEGQGTVDELFDRQYAAIVRALAVAFDDAEGAADAVQEAFIEADRRWTVSHYDEPAVWIRRVAINRLRNGRRNRRPPGRDRRGDPAGPARGPDRLAPRPPARHR